jgi:HK97 family phage major capsid protein
MEMLSLPSLKEARASKADAIRAIVAKATTENRDLTDTEQGAFDAGKTEIEKLEKDIGNAEFLADIERRVEGTPITNADAKFETEQRKYSLLKAIGHQAGMNVDAGRELEVSKELERRSGGRRAEGIFAPMSIFEKRVVVTGGATTGSNIIPTDYMGAQFIDVFREAMVIRRLGARVLNGLTGNVAIPRLKLGQSGTWVAENAAITAADSQYDQVTLTPKHCGAITEFSRNMIMQSSPDVEQLARDDFAGVLARAGDRVAAIGGGSNEPVGILATAGIGDVPGGTNGLAPTWANVIGLYAAVANSNAAVGNLGYLTNTKTVAKMCNVLKSTADTSSNFMMPNPGANALAGYPLGVTNLVPSNLTKGTASGVCSALIFGNFSDLLLGFWSEFDLLVNPYESTAYTKGNVQVRGMLTADVAIRQAKSFAATKDVLTT